MRSQGRKDKGSNDEKGVIQKVNLENGTVNEDLLEIQLSKVLNSKSVINI